MEAQTHEEIPVGDQWQYEPKWDGFRCLAFRDGESVELQSKAGQPLAPRLVAEVQYDHYTGGRFRHGTKVLRWRLDKLPGQCTMDQVKSERKSPLDLLEENE